MNEIEYSRVSAPARMAQTPAKRSNVLDVAPRTSVRSETAMVAIVGPPLLRHRYAAAADLDQVGRAGKGLRRTPRPVRRSDPNITCLDRAIAAHAPGELGSRQQILVDAH